MATLSILGVICYPFVFLQAFLIYPVLFFEAVLKLCFPLKGVRVTKLKMPIDVSGCIRHLFCLIAVAFVISLIQISETAKPLQWLLSVCCSCPCVLALFVDWLRVITHPRWPLVPCTWSVDPGSGPE